MRAPEDAHAANNKTRTGEQAEESLEKMAEIMRYVLQSLFAACLLCLHARRNLVDAFDGLAQKLSNDRLCERA